jgi:O-acetylserine/cysteine efflux transporter
MLKALIIIYGIWGFNWVVMKEANLFFTPTFFVTCRFALGAIILLLVNAWLHLPLPPRKYWKWIILTGILQLAISNVAVQIGMLDLSAGLVSVLDYSMPVWVAIMAHFVLHETLTLRKIIGIVISMVGLFILMNIDTLGSLSGILMTLFGAITWAISNIIVKLQNQVIAKDRSHGDGQDCNLIQYTTWQMVAGAVALILYSAITGQYTAQWTGMAVACLLYNAVLASAVAFFLWNYILAHMEASKASVAVLAVPVVGVVSGILFLGEALHWTTAAGMVLILLGIVLIVTQKQQKTTSRP